MSVKKPNIFEGTCLHIINGDYAASIWKKAFGDTEKLLIQHDLLSCGPLPATSLLEEWEKLRLDYLDRLSPNDERYGFDVFPNDLLNQAKKLKKAKSIYLWVATGLQDQLTILFVIYLMDTIGVDIPKLKLVLFEPQKGALAMGLLEPEQFQKYPTPRAMNPDEIDYCRKAWIALIQNEESAIKQFLSIDSPLPYLKIALNSMLNYYPDSRGLNFWDKQLLKYAKEHQPIATKIIGFTMGMNHGNGDFTGDSYLFYRLLELASPQLSQPFIKVKGNAKLLRETSIQVTDFGEQMLKALD